MKIDTIAEKILKTKSLFTGVFLTNKGESFVAKNFLETKRGVDAQNEEYTAYLFVDNSWLWFKDYEWYASSNKIKV